MRTNGLIKSLLSLIVIGWVANACGQKPPTPALSIPAYGIVDMKEGTIEMWVLPLFEPLPSEKRGFFGKGEILRLNMDPAFPGNLMSMSVAVWHGRIVLRNAVLLDQQQLEPAMVIDLPQATAKSWIHFAFTWAGADAFDGYVNGKQIKMSDSSISMIYTKGFDYVLSKDAWIALGSEWDIPVPVELDEIRVSSVARKPKDLGFAVGKLKPDEFTLLLLDFDHKDAGKVKPTAAMRDAGRIITIPKRFKTVPGKFGNALSLQ